MSTPPPGQLTRELLLAVRDTDRASVRAYRQRLSDLSDGQLGRAIVGHTERTAFWVNLYNAVVLEQPLPRLESWRVRAAFLRRRLIVVAGHALSLDAIEHGLLRRSQFRLGFGFVPNPMPARFERRHRLTRPEPRIHFALNCASASCPPIAAYQPARLDAQLDLATRAYLDAEVRRSDGGLIIPRVFLWFAGDFGGAPGIRDFLRDHDVAGAGGPIRFAPFDWTPAHGAWLDHDA